MRTPGQLVYSISRSFNSLIKNIKLLYESGEYTTKILQKVPDHKSLEVRASIELLKDNNIYQFTELSLNLKSIVLSDKTILFDRCRFKVINGSELLLDNLDMTDKLKVKLFNQFKVNIVDYIIFYESMGILIFIFGVFDLSLLPKLNSNSEYSKWINAHQDSLDNIYQSLGNLL